MALAFIGRKQELALLSEAFASPEAEMVAVIGRRRIGKTALIKQAYAGQLDFEATGIQNAPLAEQLQQFALRINQTFYAGASVVQPNNWLEVFHQLTLALERLQKPTRKVVFFDELPWFDSHKSGFVRALGYFWNSWAVNQNMVVVICGSAASWMIENVVNDRGGLHNRITRRIFLKPFTLAETRTYLESRHIHFNAYQIVQLYMAMGGVPHYLKEVKSGKSATQNIEEICFAPEGLLYDEFKRLYPALFDNAERHISLIRALATAHQGLPRTKIIQLSQLPDNGATTRVLEELIESGVVTGYPAYGKVKKDTLYRLTDEYSLFYLQFIEAHTHEGGGVWQQLSQTQTYKTWSGYAFESLWLKHLPALKKAMSIGGVYSVAATFYQKGTPEVAGVQIDLLLDRADQIINLFEIKYNVAAIRLTKAQADALQRKINAFRAATKTNKHLSLVLISAAGLEHNAHSLGLVEKVLTLEDIFAA